MARPVYNLFEMAKGRVASFVFGLLLALCGTVSAAEETPAISIEPAPLTIKAFKEFGQVVETSDARKATSEDVVHKYWAGLARTQIHGEIDLGLLTVKSRERMVAEMRRHSKTTKVIVSLKDDYILLVAPPTPPNARKAFPDASKVRVFMVAKDQVVVLKKGTWHAMPFPQGKEGLFLLAVRDGTAKSDSRERPFRKGEVIKF